MNSPFAGMKEIVIGPTGTGKTSSIATMVEAGIETFVLYTEGGLSTLLGHWTDRGLPVPTNLHWNVLQVAPMSFDEMAQQAHDINTLSYEALCRKPDPKRSIHNQFETLYRILADFPDAHLERHFGAVDTWGTGACLAIDSLSGLGPLAMSLVVGSKITLDKPHYQQAQGLIKTLLYKIVYGCRCHFILTAHPDRNVDEVQGGLKLYPAVPGKALGPQIVPMFDDALFSSREGAKFEWTANNSQIDLKGRNFPITGNFPQDFRKGLDVWKKRGGILEPFETRS